MAIGIIVLLTVILVVCLSWYFKDKELRDKINRAPGLPPLPIIGNAHQLKRKPEELLQQFVDLASQYMNHGVMRLWIGHKPVFFLFKAEWVELLLSSNKLLHKSSQYRFLTPWLGEGLLLSSGQKWFTRRKMLTPTFHFKILNDFLPVFNDHADVLVQKLSEKTSEKQIDIFPMLTLCALDAICETAMGQTVHAQENSDSEYVRAIHKMSEMIQDRQKKPWYHPHGLYYTIGPGKQHDKNLNILKQFTRKVIRERCKEFQKNYANYTMEQLTSEDGRKKRLAFLDMLLCKSEDGTVLSEDDIQEEVDTFMFEGHDTTAAGMSWAMHLIGKHPKVQKKIQEELDHVFGNSDRNATMEDMKSLKYLECCLKESLRICPSVPLYGRELTEDMNFGDYYVPAGTDVAVLTGPLHRDPRFFPEPDEFNPERFTLDKSAGRHPFAYVPFSAGPRNCIGQKFALLEEKAIISSILRRFEVTALQERDELLPMGELILRPKNGILIQLKKRTDI